MKIPKILEDKIKKIMEHRDVTQEELINDFAKIYKQEYLKEFPPDSRLSYSVRILWTQHMSHEATKSCDIVVLFGIKPKQKTKSGWRSSMYVAIKNDVSDKYTITEIVCTGSEVDKVSEIELFKSFTDVKLVDKKSFKEASSTTEFINGKDLQMDEIDFLKNQCNFPEVKTLREIVNHISGVDANGYVNRTDMFIVNGITTRAISGDRKDGTKFCLYEIMDDSLGFGDEEIIIVGKNKVVIPKKITVWVPERFYLYDTDSVLTFIGTVQIGREDKAPFMNACNVIPNGIVREMVIGDEENEN